MKEGPSRARRLYNHRIKEIYVVMGSKRILTDVVSDVVSDGGRVPGVVLGDAVHDLSDEVSSDVGSFGVDAAADAPEHGDAGATEAVAGDAVGEGGPVGIVGALEDHEGGVENDHAEAAQGEAHNRAGAEGGVEAGSPAGLVEE